MQSSNIPSKIPLPFGYAAGSGYINSIPSSSQIGIVNGRASLHDGFPPDTFIPIASGGVPPFGGDVNGILNEITAIQQWQEAGGFFPFDATFAGIIGGYPKGAILQSSTFAGLWVSTIENNTNNPDTTGTGWASFAFDGVQTITMSSSSVTLTTLQSAYPIIVINGTLTSASNLIIPAEAGDWILVNNTTGSYNLTAKTPSGTGITLTQGQSTYAYSDGVNIYFADSSKVASFNGRVGTITLNATDVVNALGYTPYSASNPSGYISSVSYSMVIAALGYTPIPNTKKFGLGITGETWNNVIGSRSANTTYTNPYSYPIVVSIGSFAATGGSATTITVGGVVACYALADGGGVNEIFPLTAIVPPGATYSLTSIQAPQSWSELY